MNAITTVTPSQAEVTLLKLAREIAMDIQPLDTILEAHQITRDQWESISKTPHFLRLLGSEAETWNTALNTHERVKLKAAAMIEEWLPELNNRMHDKLEGLPAKIEGGKLLTKIAGMGERVIGSEGVAGERFVVTINLGEDVKLKFDKELPPKVIEGELAD
jgi:hypothetical protein